MSPSQATPITQSTATDDAALRIAFGIQFGTDAPMDPPIMGSVPHPEMVNLSQPVHEPGAMTLAVIERST